MNESVSMEGTVEEIVFTNEANGYTVCEVSNGKDTFMAVGYMPFINTGEIIKVTGNWVTHPDYGEQLKVLMYEKKLPNTIDAIEKYLSSGIIKGVGPATAEKIIARFGIDAIDIVQFRPEMLSEIKGISIDKAFRIGQAFEEQREMRSVVMFLQEYGINPSLSAKIYKTFGGEAIKEIKNNPYCLAGETFGIGFRTADKIAMSIGIDASSKNRICSGIKHVLSQAATNGHTFVPAERLQEYTSRLLDLEVESLEGAFISLSVDKSICIERDGEQAFVYLAPFLYSEIGVCRKITELLTVDFSNDFSDIDVVIEGMEKEDNIVFAQAQKTAIKEALNSGVLVITGGPGTGKTTIIKSIIKLFNNKGCEVLLAAPTGRAAKRMSEATGFEAKTIHRLLEIGYMDNGSEPVFMRNESNPLDAGVIIIDETSMVDILLMNHLLKAVRCGSRLILVGDVNQLPSVGPGNVLKDIISSSLVNTVKLTEIFRQAEESLIIVNAHRINRGEKPDLSTKDKDFFFLPRRDAEDIVKTIVELCNRRIPTTYGFDPGRHIQVLTPTRKGPCGVSNLNIELQKALNPPQRNKNEKLHRDFRFREGDRVMQVKNNYNLKWRKEVTEVAEGTGVFNGDAGIISRIDLEEQKLEVGFEDDRLVEYDFSILDEIEPAFATTIHKSQGSEFPVVIIPIFQGPPVLMTKNLLYTAVTRARSLVILVGFESSLYGMIHNEREMLRFSRLAIKLRTMGGIAL